MSWIQLSDGKSIQIIEKLRAYSDDEVYFKVGLEDRKIKIISEDELNNLKEKDQQGFSEAQKLALFHDYFRGRPDVYATKYYNKKGKPGFSPHGDFDWEEVDDKFSKGTKWQKNMISYYPYRLETIKKHIMGKEKDFKYGAGIYPMLKDDTCYLLVMDFDKKNAEKEARALSQTAKNHGISYLIERSQSGEGIHLWFFFDVPVSARLARQMGSALISGAMLESEYIKFSTFDRMIPMQDTLPQNSFGNLIALPLRWEKVKEKKTVFLDENFTVVNDQWRHLSQIKKISKNELVAQIDKLKNTTDFPNINSNKIEGLVAQLGGELMVDKTSISRNDCLQLEHLATFGNPDFIKLQKMRATTWNTPRYITGATEDDHHLYLPRGIYDEVIALAEDAEVNDELNDGEQIDVGFKGELRDDQQKAVNTMMKHSIGILSASTGFGKTVVTANVISERQLSTLIIVNSKVLARQWKEQLNEFLDIHSEPMVEYTPTGRIKKKDKIGEIHSTKTNQSKIIDIALFQTLANRDDFREFIRDYGMVIVDEAHHIAAQSFEFVIKQVASRYLYGLSATPERKDGYTPLIGMRLGDVIYEHQETQADTVMLPQYFYPRFTNYAEFAKELSYTEHIEALLNDRERNEQILEDIVENVTLGRTCIVLTERIEHVQILKELLIENDVKQSVFVVTGKEGQKVNQKNIEVMKEFDQPYILLATGKYIGEGFDLHQLDTIFLTLPISWKGRLRQYLGRLQRDVANKDELRVYDYIDLGISMFANMYQKRFREYKKLRYKMAEDGKTKALEAGLYESNTYYSDLEKDLKQCNSIVAGVPALSAGLVKVMLENASEGKSLKVITKQATARNGRVHQRQKEHVEALQRGNITVNEAEKISQSFIILDNEIAWYGNINFYGYVNAGSTAIRFRNSKLVDQIVNQYRK
ncbi:TOTE conflict system archaeo-eukaryotic primase domain-containing protein [Salinicoccus albus]|uniref:TOTE conflict system archaeo-eukaryotic primase domain-containing protein n=1 Tax=Salinicoccus albus TaxID=418756 RepID=UPI00037F44D7|nr:DEAD/DEAH box helicase family protein [Salinicoccus albus]